MSGYTKSFNRYLTWKRRRDCKTNYESIKPIEVWEAAEAQQAKEIAALEAERQILKGTINRLNSERAHQLKEFSRLQAENERLREELDGYVRCDCCQCLTADPVDVDGQIQCMACRRLVKVINRSTFVTRKLMCAVLEGGECT